MIETHESPGEAKSDGPQAVPLDQIGTLLRTLGANGGAANGANGARIEGGAR